MGGQGTYAEERAGLEEGGDVVVSTPGRLMEHVLHTPGFSLRFLEFLVPGPARPGPAICPHGGFSARNSPARPYDHMRILPGPAQPGRLTTHRVRGLNTRVKSLTTRIKTREKRGLKPLATRVGAVGKRPAAQGGNGGWGAPADPYQNPV